MFDFAPGADFEAERASDEDAAREREGERQGGVPGKGSRIATIFGLVQLSIGQSPWALLVAPGTAVLGALVYGASFVGQGLGSEQMYFLRATLTESVAGEDATDPPSSA